MTLGLIFGSVTVVSLISLAGVFTLSIKPQRIRDISLLLVALAAGALLGDAFLHILPESYADGNSLTISLAVLFGVLIVMLFERLLWWHHDHHERESLDVHDAEGHDAHAAEHARIEPIGRIALFSDALHNFLDGVAIAASFLVSPEIGFATTIAIIFHEIPQEIGDFGILLHAGYSRTKALWLNLLTALTAVLGALATVLLGGFADGVVDLLLPVAAGSFLYIALADLIPELHKRRGAGRFAAQIGAMLLGIVLMYSLLFLEA